MLSTTRFIALALAGTMLVACAHKDSDKNAPLAFVPADTPYVAANLDVLDDETRQALLAQADAQLPSQLANMDSAAYKMAKNDPDGARLLRTFRAELNGKNIETFAQNAGIDLKGYLALYGLGLSPVLRLGLSDPKAFEGFISRLEAAYGKKFDVANIAGQSYRQYTFPASGTEVILALVGKQAVAALLPAQAAAPLLREALGLDRPEKSLQDDGRLNALAKAKGYKDWLVGDLDLTRALPLAVSGQDPLFAAIIKAHAEAESAKTGEPVANQLQSSPSCSTEAGRVASRVPGISFGYTQLDSKHQDVRFDIALADDVSKAFAGLKVDLAGLGSSGTAPFDVSIALPIAQLRAFWTEQADAVAAQPFSCPALNNLNAGFAQLAQSLPKAAIPPFGDMLGIRLTLDTLESSKQNGMPTFTGRLVLATNNPSGLLAVTQMMIPALSQLRPKSDGKPVALPADVTALLRQPAWIALSEKALAIGIGTGEDAPLADALKAPTGDAGRMMRMHVSGAMYLAWLQLMEQKIDTFAATAAAFSKNDATATPESDGNEEDPATIAANAARSKAQFAAMEAHAAQISSIDAETHVEDSGLVISSQTLLK